MKHRPTLTDVVSVTYLTYENPLITLLFDPLYRLDLDTLRCMLIHVIFNISPGKVQQKVN